MRIYLYTVLGAVKTQSDRQGGSWAGSIALIGAPTPPSSNVCYANRKTSKGGFGRKLTSEAVQWGYECNAWALTQLPALAALRLMAAQKQPLHVHVRFWFPQSDIWTKEGEVKKLDPPNFLKLIIDNVAAYASMDDSLFFHVSCEKRPHPNPANTRRLTDLTIDYYK